MYIESESDRGRLEKEKGESDCESKRGYRKRGEEEFKKRGRRRERRLGGRGR